jgi:hypothetical protein
MLSESARMTTAAEARFRIQATNPTARVVRVINLETATAPEIARLVQEVPAVDLVVMVVAPGSDAHAAAIIGQACSDARVMTTTIVVNANASADAALSNTLSQVRPWSLMVVVASDHAYVDDILTSFR